MKKNKILFVGDFRSNTGPAIINKNIKESLGNKAMYTYAKGKVLRLIELFLKTLISDKICFCSLSKMNIYGIKLAKKMNKKTFYIMHGYSRYEQKIKGNIDEERIKIEEYVISSVDKIFCVSKKFKEFMERQRKDYKFDYVYNGVKWTNFDRCIEKKKYQIISSGGGIIQKHNLQVCEAIKQINDKRIKYIIVGPKGDDIDKILKYNFVEFFETMEQSEYLRLVSQSSLYIQNSIFETFGMAIMEALNLKCDILVSANIGAIDLMNNINSNDLIFNNNDINEISEKIKNILEKGNNEKIMNSIDKELTSVNFRANELFNKIIHF